METLDRLLSRLARMLDIGVSAPEEEEGAIVCNQLGQETTSVPLGMVGGLRNAFGLHGYHCLMRRGETVL